jgi:phosphoribosyl 1,2-cyclic phosphodiesterase
MIRFRTLRSGSSGNLLLLESERPAGRARYLIDCGISSQRALRRILEEEVGLSAGLDGVFLTHAHSDHINYASLRVLAELGVPVYAHRRTLAEVRARHLNPYRLPARVDFSSLELRAFGDGPFRLDGLEVVPVPVPHAPGVTTHAFVLRTGGTKLLVASDFSDPEAVAGHIADCDLIYIESNHDLELLRLRFNPASLYHLPNPAAGLLLRFALTQSANRPRAIVLGHLSEERNTPDLALETVRAILAEGRGHEPPPLVAAPRYEPGQVVELTG